MSTLYHGLGHHGSQDDLNQNDSVDAFLAAASADDVAFLNSYLRECEYRNLPPTTRLWLFLRLNWAAITFTAVVPLGVLALSFIAPAACAVLTGWQSYLTLFLVTAALVVMMHGAAPDFTMIAVNIVLMLTGIITSAEAVAGMASTSILAVGVLFVVAKGVEEAGTITFLLASALGSPKTVGEAVLRLSVPVAVLSSFMNNAPVVAMMIPVVQSWCGRTGHPPSKLLIPLSFASTFGGCCTLLGTATNLVLKDLAAGHSGAVAGGGSGSGGEADREEEEHTASTSRQPLQPPALLRCLR